MLVKPPTTMTRKLIHTEVGARIAQVRKKHRLKRYEFAKVLGITPATAGNYERGQMPRADVLDRIAKTGDVTVEWLLHGTEQSVKRTASRARVADATFEPLFTWPNVAPSDLLGLAPRYLKRYKARLRRLVRQLRSDLNEYRRVLILEYRAELRMRKRKR